jgi:putative ABC transport system permease protein
LSTYTFHITPYDLAFLGAIFIGLTFTLLLWFTKKINRAANRFLSVALLTIVLQMARVLGIDIRLGIYFPHWSWLPLQFSLGLGPLIYFYVRKIARPEYKFRFKDLLHFSPLLLEFGVQLLEVRESVRTGAATYDTLIFQQLNPVLQLLVFISVSTYLYASYRLIERFYRGLKFTGGDRYRYELRWLYNLLIGFSCLWILWIPFTAVNYFYYHDHVGQHAYYPLYLILAVMMIWIAAVAYLRPEVSIPGREPLFSKPSPSGELRQKGIWLKKAMEANRFYQDAELSLPSLAEALDIPIHELSRIINVALKKNFNDFINEYRVRDVARKMQEPEYDHLTLLGIAFESGFNSKTTFHRIFKLMSGKSPAEYKTEQKKEIPSYNLEPYPRSTAVILCHEVTPKWSYEKLNRNFMLRNYLKIAWRNTLNNKVYSALNIVGLATGMAVALLIGLWVFNQLSYDHFLPNYQQAYAVKVNYTNPQEGTHTSDAVALPLAGVLRSTIPGIKYVAEADLVDFPTHDFMVGDKKLIINGGTVAPDFLKIFQYPLVKGNVNSVLKDPFSIVLDESTAKALFGDDDPVNKTIRIDNQHDVKVTGVMKDFPADASMQFHFLMPFSYAEEAFSFVKNARSQWDNSSFQTFVGLQPGVTSAQVAAKIKNLVYQNNPAVRAFKPEVFLYPLKDWHLYSDFQNGKAVGGFIDYVRMFGIIGALVLLIACINFVNLSTARSEKRAREVGVRKAIGSRRRDLIFQFLTESVFITFVAFLLSILFVLLALPNFNTLTGSLVKIPYSDPIFWCIMLGYVLITGLLAGSRPAFYLSAFNTVKVLKGSIQLGKAAALPRKILVVLQFSCSVAFIISTVIIYQQIQYAKDRPAGYSIDRLVTTFMTTDLANHYDALKNDLVASGMVRNVTKASSPLTNIAWHTGIANWPGQSAGELPINVGAIITDDNYFKTVGMKLVEGHNFSSNPDADNTNIIVNESAVKRMGLKDPINQLITFNGINGRSRIIGVVKDALMESPFTPVQPLVFTHGPFGTSVIYRLAPRVSPHSAIEKIGKIFDKYNPAYPFTYGFVNEAYDHKFNLETLVGKLAGIFAGLAIFVSCLGLFGLAAYVAEQRTKEIAVRKILGASITQVWVLLSGDFILLVTISCVIASPVALYFISGWLQKYDYRISIGPGVFILSGIMAIIITLFTISFQSIKSALANPVKSLRSE